jgi:hypothetical protein
MTLAANRIQIKSCESKKARMIAPDDARPISVTTISTPT